jgi:hypothetical protein
LKNIAKYAKVIFIMTFENKPAFSNETGHERAQSELDKFAQNPGLTEMAKLFGQEELSTEPQERLAQLQELAAANWDFRKGAERQATDWDNELLDQEGSEQWNTIFDSATKLGMVESSRPRNRNPDSLVILGGANKAPYDRLHYGIENVDNFGLVAYLGSSRPVNEAEREKAKDYAPDAQTEFDLGCGAFETLLQAHQVSEDRVERNGDIWAWREYEFEIDGETRTGFVLNTPQQIHDTTAGSERRATTYDNYRFFADRAELQNNPDHTVVAVTTGFYVPGQHLPAVQTLTLPYGTAVETIGHDAAYSGAVRKPSQLLQETKAAIDAAVRLHDALTQ